MNTKKRHTRNFLLYLFPVCGLQGRWDTSLSLEKFLSIVLKFWQKIYYKIFAIVMTEEAKKPEDQKTEEEKKSENKPAEEATYPDAETVKLIIPSAPMDSIKKNAPHVFRAMGAGGLTSKNQLVGILATIQVETASFGPVAEIGGKGQRYAPYYGRGYIQLTWKSNYELFEKASGHKVVANPDLVLQPEIAAQSTVFYWKGGTGNNPSVPAEAGDWTKVRRAVQGGTSQLDRFLQAVERGKKYLKSGIKGNFPLGADYGLGCADGGNGSELNLTGVGNPGSLGDAMAYVLGVYSALNQYSHTFRGYLNPHAMSELLILQAQDKFTINNLGEDLDGDYTIEEVTFLGPYSDSTGIRKSEAMEMEVVANRPNPNAPQPNVFPHDSNSALIDPNQGSAPPSGDIQQRIYQSGIKNKGQSTKNSPPACDRGNKACAWALNKFCIIPAGLKPLGAGAEGSLAVGGCIEALEGGRGKKVPLDQVVPGDIWADAGATSKGGRHIGIFTEAGGKKVLSNSSSDAAFKWEDTAEAMGKYYGGGLGDNFWRVTS